MLSTGGGWSQFLKITKAGTQLHIENLTRAGYDAIYEFINKRLVTWQFARKVNGPREIDAVFAATHLDGSIMLHSNVWSELQLWLMQNQLVYKLEELPPYPIKKVVTKLISKIKLYNYQVKAIDFLNQDSSPTKLIGFPPGYGKTIAFLNFLSVRQELACCVMKLGYAEQWRKTIPKILNIRDDEIFFIRSSKSIKHLIGLAKTNTFKYKIILFANASLHAYLKPAKTDEYEMSVGELFRRLGVGILLIDEVHENLHQNYLLCSAIKVPKVIGLSATFDSRDSKVKYFQRLLFPFDDRYDIMLSDPYIDYIETNIYLPFNVMPNASIRGNPAYSQIAFEEWWLKRPVYLKQLLLTLMNCANKGYLNHRKPGQKLMFYAMRLDMVDKIVGLLELADLNLKVITYREGDAYERLLDADIIVTTPIKAGAAVDIPGLITIISLYMTFSMQRVIQMMGRLRRIEATELFYFQLLCPELPKHAQYQQGNKFDIIDSRVKNYHVLHLPQYLTSSRF